MQKTRITVIICTANRKEIVLQSLQSVTDANCQYPIALIDNNRDKILSAYVLRLASLFNCKYIKEDKKGLSHARNKGIQTAKSHWLLFLDDDIQLPMNFFEVAEKIIATNQFDCFGGMYYPWYPAGKPKWMPADFGQKMPICTTTRQIDVTKEGFLSAGIFAVKKSAIEAVGGFRTDLGMGKSIGYGEENELQMRLQAAGYTIGFVPDWYLYHAVLPHKQKVSWHLKSAYAHGRDGQRIYRQYSLYSAILRLAASLTKGLFFRLPQALYRLITDSSFYFANAVLFVFEPVLHYAGRVVGCMKR